MGVLFPEDGVSRAKETLEAYEARGGCQALRRGLEPEAIVGLVEAAA
jgi:hypothetical protein